jgi:hypothetical protein
VLQPGPTSLHVSARTALAVPLRYARAGSSLAHAALAGAHDFEVLRHYPERDVVDATAGTRFYYHAHRLDDPEHGHFHLFVHGQRAGEFMHLAALSLDVNGQPMRWFTTNRWVTGEHWRPAAQLLPHLRRWHVRTGGRLAPVATWLNAMVALYADELAQLLRERDARMAPLLQGRSRAGCEAVLEDRSLDVISECPALLATKISQLVH